MALVAPPAAGAATHVFNPVLSLTGDCSTLGVDEVADPGLCPMPPGVPGVDHPTKPFLKPISVATDSYGDIYVSDAEHIDIFDPQGVYITEIADSNGPKSIGVDSEGNLYVFDFTLSSSEIVRYAPIPPYNPAGGEITYGKPTAVNVEGAFGSVTAIAVNPTNDHLFVHRTHQIAEYSSAKEGNNLIDNTIGSKDLVNSVGKSTGLAVDAVHKRLYASDDQKVRVFELDTPHKLLMTITGSETPSEEEFAGLMSLAADEGTGHFFVYDGGGSNAVSEFGLNGEYISSVENKIQNVFGAQIAIDNGKSSPNGALNPFVRFLFVPSHPSGTGHLFAFGPPAPESPVVEGTSFANVTDTEGELLADIKPEYLETTYAFEYTARQHYEEEGGTFSGATRAAEGSIPASGSPLEVSASLEGLMPDTTYVFRVVAENEKGSDESEGEFATYPAEAPELTPCVNGVLRTDASGLLPDCRAYELVTPSDTNGRTPLSVGHLGTYFATQEASSQGNAVTFDIEGGSIPGFEATGSYAGDPYISHRTEGGWSTEYAGPSGEEAPALLPGSNSPDQGYSLWSTASGEGSAAVEDGVTNYLHYPDGHSALVGRGSLGTDPRAQGLLISEGGSHVIFRSGTVDGPAVQLEEDAPPDGTGTIYDRTIDPETGEEQTHVISLLPEDEVPVAGQNAEYLGASLDGTSVAFKIGSILYFRYDNDETYEVAGAGASFAGFSEGGKRIFYLEGGNLYAYEAEGGANPIQFSSSGNATPVNVTANGNVAYFVSASVLTGEANPAGALPQAGQQNLYRSEEGILGFIGTVTKRDVEGEDNGNEILDGLGLWIQAVGPSAYGGPGRFGEDPSRTTPDGQVLLFESRAALTGYDPKGHAEIYRYDSASNELTCLSCNPTLAPAAGEASLQSITKEQGSPEPGRSFVLMNNLRADGQRAVFQSTEPLVIGDTDELQDVYEWEAQGVGSCERTGGCVYLISSGQSHRIDYLWAVSDSGDDVFFRSSDLLLGRDTDATPSIYDARVGGGFAEPEPGAKDCADESCHPALTPPPVLPPSRTVPLGPPENVVRCPKGKRQVVRNGKTVCVKKHKKRHHRKAGTNKRGAAR